VNKGEFPIYFFLDYLQVQNKRAMKNIIRNLIAAYFLLSLGLLFSCTQPTETAQYSKKDTVTVTMTKALLDSLSPGGILQKFKEGNERFVSGNMLHPDYMQQVAITASGQYPYAIVVSCIDSRNPAELIFDQGIGDIFNARVAGNFVNTDIIGSIEYACKVAGAKLILIVGHTECGAIKSACDHVQLGNITALLANIKPALDSVGGFANDRNSKNTTFVQAVAKENVLLAQKNILSRSPIIQEMVAQGQVKIAGCMYDIKTGRVEFYD
jgi:carbonic anhydrase